MDVFKIFILLSAIFLNTGEGVKARYPSAKCSHGGPDIRPPFQIRGQQTQLHDCSRSFELFCKQNETMIHFPSFGDLVVTSISYDIKKLSLLDPNSCIHGVFLNLNISLTPFRYYYDVKEYTYLNCSAGLPPPFIQVPCLSGSTHHVYVVESPKTPSAYCKAVKSIAIPFSYSPYLAGNSFGLGLSWDSSGDDKLEAREGSYVYEHSYELVALCIGVIGFMVALLILKTYRTSKNLDAADRENGQNEVENDKMLLPGEYEALESGRDDD